MRFKIFGPFEIPLHEGQAGWIDGPDTKIFWEEVESKVSGLSEACGVYLFGMFGDENLQKTVASKDLPWYVGKAEKQTFKKECFNSKNKGSYNKVITKIYKQKGTPFLYLLARMEDDNQTFSKPTEREYPGVTFVEKMFIQNTLAVNVNIENSKDTKVARDTLINGILNSKRIKGKTPSRVVDFKKMLNIENLESIEFTQNKSPVAALKCFINIYGPYEVPQMTSKKIITPVDVGKFWSDVDGKKDSFLKDQRGIYVFALRNGGNDTPWFVGSSQQITFADIVFARYNDMYAINNILEKRNGTPNVYFLPFVDNKMQLSQKPPVPPISNIRFVKSVLFEYGVPVNKHILSDDSNDSKMWKDLYVQGLINATQGDSTNSVKELKKLLKIS